MQQQHRQQQKGRARLPLSLPLRLLGRPHQQTLQFW
jgi:hypothetical protein